MGGSKLGGRKGSDGEAAEALLEEGDVEVDEESDGQAQEFEVGDELGFVDGEEAVHGFELEDDMAVDDEVETVAAVEGEAFVGEGERNLTLDVKFAQGELMREAVLVGRFEKSRPQVAVDLDAGADDGLRNPLPPPFLRFSLFHFRVVGATSPEVASESLPNPIPSPFLPVNLRAFPPPLLPPILPSSLFNPSGPSPAAPAARRPLPTSWGEACWLRRRMFPPSEIIG